MRITKHIILITSIAFALTCCGREGAPEKRGGVAFVDWVE